MNFEVGEKRTRVPRSARSRKRARMRGAGALLRRLRLGAGPAGGAAGRVECAGGAWGSGPAGAGVGGESCALSLRRDPATQLRWGLCPLLP